MPVSTPSHRTLDSLSVGESGVIQRFETPEPVQLRLMQMGLWPGEHVTVFHRAPLGGPLQIDVMGYRLAIRRSDAQHIWLQ